MPDHQEFPTFCTRFRGSSCHVGSTDESRITFNVFSCSIIHLCGNTMTIPALRFQKVSCRVSRTQHGSNRSKWKLDPRDGQMGKLLIQKNINFCIRQCHKRFLHRCRAPKLLAAQRCLPLRCEMYLLVKLLLL